MKVYNFFKNRIASQYPAPKDELNPYEHMAEQHEAFMKNRCRAVYGREEILKQVSYNSLSFKNGSYLT